MTRLTVFESTTRQTQVEWSKRMAPVGTLIVLIVCAFTTCIDRSGARGTSEDGTLDTGRFDGPAIEGRTWTLDPNPSVVIADSEDVPLLNVSRVLFSDSGSIVVANAGFQEVLLFDSTGSLMQVVGGLGEGPGEFRRMTDLYGCSGDSIVVNDFDRVHVFDSHGNLGRTFRIPVGDPQGGLLRVLGVSEDCGSVLVRRDQVGGGPRVGAAGPLSSELFWMSVGGNHERDSVATVVVREIYHRRVESEHLDLVTEPTIQSVVPWGRRSVWAVAGDLVYLGDTGMSQISVYRRTQGLVGVIEWNAEPRLITESDRNSLMSRRERWVPTVAPLRVMLPELHRFPSLPRTFPFLIGILVDDEGRLWVRSYPEHVVGVPDIFGFGGPLWSPGEVAGSEDEWSVFDPSGIMLATIKMPSARPVLGIARGNVATLARDSLDAESIQLFRISTGER